MDVHFSYNNLLIRDKSIQKIKIGLRNVKGRGKNVKGRAVPSMLDISGRVLVAKYPFFKKNT